MTKNSHGMGAVIKPTANANSPQTTMSFLFVCGLRLGCILCSGSRRVSAFISGFTRFVLSEHMQPEPVEGPVRPDPERVSPASMDAADAGHARTPQGFGIGRKFGADEEDSTCLA